MSDPSQQQPVNLSEFEQLAGRSARIALAVLVLVSVPAAAQDCNETSVGLTPLTELGASTYLGEFVEVQG